MTTTTNYQQEPHNFDDESIAQLVININQNEEFSYSCDWDMTDRGIKAISSIFYGIAYDDLMEKILKQLKEQCVLEGNEEGFLQIVSYIKDFVLLSNSSKDTNSGGASGDSLAVSPRDVLKL